MSMFIYRGGPGGRSIARMRLEQDGSVTLTTGVMDVGEGSLTVLAQIAAEALSIPIRKGERRLRRHPVHTAGAHTTAGSTATFSGGLAVKRAAEQLKSRIVEVAAVEFGTAPECVDLVDGIVTDGTGRRMDLAKVAALR